MATSSISGLASGLDTASIIDSLMQLEAAPQTRLKTKITSEQSVLAKLQSLNTSAKSLGDLATELAKPATWTATTATSSNSNISVTADSTAGAVSLSVSVLDVARTTQRGFVNTAAKTDVVTGATNTVTLTKADGSSFAVDSGDGTLSGLVNALNTQSADTGVRASLVSSGGGYRMLLESTSTGVDTGFTLTAEDGSDILGGSVLRAGTDARIDVGGGIEATSTSNTFTDLLPGVDVTLSAATQTAETASLSVGRDVASLASKFQSLVDGVNGLVAIIDTGTAYNSTTKTSGVLAGDSSVRDLRSRLLGAVFPGDGTTMANLGLQTDRYGKLTFDADTFTEAYNADPDGVAAQITSTSNGYAKRVADVAVGASKIGTGTLTTAIESRQTGISRLQDDVDNWDTRLELRRATLQNQFTALETALAQMQSQSSWLAGQLSSLSSS
ncbi:flagellar filament capping protein FliD [Nocardioides sp. GY 10127]|uniref:flagellar filament capping protein FliD n=1 Tax=Nocardioides sp. GY 10127 TaxID=2569762 RepID=UPI0010A8DFF2|nr:flagellar filament capping protein FliD [Nocardioides sp. GY 10127]TIC78619.1 hypothetical protein E8D37_19385 [Nocardioides sp. GY 10127]